MSIALLESDRFQWFIAERPVAATVPEHFAAALAIEGVAFQQDLLVTFRDQEDQDLTGRLFI
ncbi:hypothetical protein [Haloferula sp.]|uniref:hypothetical protein n=1 Tax=Haloferula sp. TaxID=2497595 RepID=UPI003C724DBB